MVSKSTDRRLPTHPAPPRNQRTSRAAHYQEINALIEPSNPPYGLPDTGKPKVIRNVIWKNSDYMDANIVTRKIAGWEFCNDNVSLWDANIHPDGIHALEKGNRKIAEWFIAILRGRSRVIDIGCGAGFPSLYLAPHVGNIIAIDAALNMIHAAKENAKKMDIRNVQFKVGGTESLPFPKGCFDGALLCGVLENMELNHANRMVAEIYRILADGARLAVIDQDWEDVIGNKSTAEWFVRLNGEKIILQHLQRNVSPHFEKDTRYLVKSTGTMGQRLREILKNKPRVPTNIRVNDLDAEDVIDAWYDESVQFDRHTINNLITSAGFRDVEVESLPVWSQRILFLKAIKRKDTI